MVANKSFKMILGAYGKESLCVVLWRTRHVIQDQRLKQRKNKGRRSRQKHSKQQDNTSMTVTVLVQGIRLFRYRRLYSISQSSLVN